MMGSIAMQNVLAMAASYLEENPDKCTPEDAMSLQMVAGAQVEVLAIARLAEIDTDTVTPQ